MKYTVKTPATVLPVSLAKARAHLRELRNLDDDYITDLIWTAADKLQSDTGRVLTETEYYAYFDGLSYSQVFHADLLLYKCPVKEVSEIATLVNDEATTYTAWDAANYTADIINEPARIVMKDAPDYGTLPNSIRVTFKAGYDTIPYRASQALMLLIGHFYEVRQMVQIGGTVSELPMTYRFLVDQLKYEL